MMQRRLGRSARKADGNLRDQVVEPELDMERNAIPAWPFQRIIKELARWIMPRSREIRPPARAVDRELAEAWPVRDY
ncbi:MAG: hypothetical protein ACREP6_15145 [Candidatus Binataceae bacterium]